MKGAWRDSNLAIPAVPRVAVTVDYEKLVGHDGMLDALLYMNGTREETLVT
jgi:hypothetical protein